MLGVYVFMIVISSWRIDNLPLYNLSFITVFGLKSIFPHITIAIHKWILYRQHIVLFFFYSTSFGWRILSSLLSDAVADIGSPCPSSLFQAKYISVLLVMGYGNTKVGSSCGTLKGCKAGHLLLLFLSWWGDLFLDRKFLLGAEQYRPGGLDEAGKMKLAFLPFLQLFSCLCSTILVIFFFSGLLNSPRVIFVQE